MTTTPRLKLPLLSVAQAQKEATHNEALVLLDAIVAGSVEEAPRAAPPAAPVQGASYIIANGASGIWAGKSGQLASFTSGGWRYSAPFEGLRMFVKSSAIMAVYRAGAWDVGPVRATSVVIANQQVVGSRLSAIPSPTSGSIIDSQARVAIDTILNALRQHGLIET